MLVDQIEFVVQLKIFFFQSTKRPVTSSNIFQLLLTEPIKRSWVSADTVLPVESGQGKNEVKPKTMQKPHVGSDGVTDGSSIDDEIPEVFSSDEDFEKDWW